MPEFLDVDPLTLRLPYTRPDGADPFKLARQLARFRNTFVGMPAVEVIRCANGELMIVNGVTRATRMAQECPGQKIRVEVISEQLSSDINHQPLLGDRLP